MHTTTIGFIGLGKMGAPMSRQLIAAGYAVTVFNRNKDKEAALKDQGAAIAATPKELIANTAVVIVMVTDDQAIRELFNGEEGLLKADISGKIIINMSTVSPAISREMAALCEQHGGNYLDAPVSGSVKQAETAQLVIMAGGDELLFKQVEPILLKMGKAATYIGKTGVGNAAKLAINTLLSFHALGLAEAVVLARQNNINVRVLMELLNDGAMANPFMKIKGDALINENYAPAFSLKNIVKDLQLAKDIGLSTPLGGAALKAFGDAEIKYGDEDLIAVIKDL